jgi:DNA polymerase-3 subunit gamma/tau
MSLHIDYRPKTLAEVAGNRSTVDSLEAVLSRDKDIPHSFLFTGNSGCGKTTLGRIVASTLGCAPEDLKEVDVADFRGIDTIREIRQQARLRPMAGPCRVWILDEAQALTKDAQNALLKILEDTPSHVYFIICTTNPEKLLKTIRSRCMTFQVNPLSTKQMTRLLKGIVEMELDGDALDQFPEEAYKSIHKSSNGHVRAAVVILDKIIDLPAKSILKAIDQAEGEEAQVIDLCRILLKGGTWKKVSTILKSIQQDQDAESVRYGVLGYMNSVLLSSGDVEAAKVIEAFKEPFYNSGKAGLTAACFDCVML